MYKRFVCAAISGILSCSVAITSFAADTIVLEGNTKIIQSDGTTFVNPWNQQKIHGVGESGMLRALDGNGSVTIPLAEPIYRFSNAYRDTVIRRNTAWGVERNIIRLLLDGTENWELRTEPEYQNDTSVLFSTKLTKKAKVPQGISTHFQSNPNIMHSSNLFDGFTIDAANSMLYIRIMNVRGCTDVESLRAYFKQQKEAGSPVTVLYPAEQAFFQAFPTEIRKQLEKMDESTLSFTDSELEKLPAIPSNNPFVLERSAMSERFARVAEPIQDIAVYGAKEGDLIYFTSVQAKDGYCELSASWQSGSETTSLTGIIPYNQIDFRSSKQKELMLYRPNGEWGKIVLFMDYSRFTIPESDDTFAEEGLISSKCYQQDAVVLPDKIPVVEGHSQELYINNVISSGNAQETANRKIEFTPESAEQLRRQQIGWNNGYSEIEWVSVPKTAGAGEIKTVLFIGDSLTNQNTYTAEVKKLFAEDPMNIATIGTQGEQGNRHEGRGGYSAYDYCREPIMYGVTNPFLYDNRFNFPYYMKQNGFVSLDAVWINLGINDVNKDGHNSVSEILSYYQEMIDSIKRYNPEIQIFVGLPTLLYSKDSTVAAKNKRLTLIAALKEKYGQMEEEKIYLAPLYAGIDPLQDYKWEKTGGEDADSTMVVVDTTHPAESGYQKMALTTYNVMKYAAWKEAGGTIKEN